MKLYARRTSSNSQKVLWFLGELGLDYEFVATGGDSGGLQDPAYLEMNPNGMVPTLVDGSRIVWESHAILRYLAAAHAPDDFWPNDPGERSEIDRWIDWSQSQFDVSFMSLFWGHWRTPEATRKVKLNAFHAERCHHYLGVLDGQLEKHAYVGGDGLTLADIPAGSLMYRYANLDVTQDMPRNVARWYAALCEREAFQTHVMLRFDELKGRLAH
jgi:glutathione S-transferase